MQQSINKKRIYLYLLIFFFLSTIFNLNIISIFHDLKKIKIIDIKGLKETEENLIRQELKIYKDNNIFLINKKEVLDSLSIFKFIDNISIHKVLPSKLTIFAKKTKLLGISILDGNKFYIGANSELIPFSQVQKKEGLPLVFGKFQINEFLKLQEILIEKKINLNSINKYFYYQSKRWDIEFYNGTILMLPYRKIDNSIEIYVSLVKDNRINSNSIIDLRVPNKIILTHDEK